MAQRRKAGPARKASQGEEPPTHRRPVGASTLREIWDEAKLDAYAGRSPKSFAEFVSPKEAEEYAKAYAKVAPKLNRRTRIFGDADWWRHPEREWQEGTFWNGGAEAWSSGGNRPGRPFTGSPTGSQFGPAPMRPGGMTSGWH